MHWLFILIMMLMISYDITDLKKSLIKHDICMTYSGELKDYNKCMEKD